MKEKNLLWITPVLTLLVALLASAGLIFPITIYPTEALSEAFLANDLVNLILGIPVLLLPLLLARRGNLTGRLLWPGAFAFVLYNSAAYVVGLPLGWLTAAYSLQCVLSLVGMVTALQSLAPLANMVVEKLDGKTPAKLTGIFLIAFGLLFMIRALAVILPALAGGDSLPAAETADFIISPLWIAYGLLLFRRKPMGFAAALAWLYEASMLFLGLILFLLLQPLMTAVPFMLVDVLVVLAMGLFFFVPFVLFLRHAR